MADEPSTPRDGGERYCPTCGRIFDGEDRFCPRDGSALVPRGAAGDLVGRVIGGRYQALRILGAGGMGEVYLARHLRIDRLCAVKVLHTHLTRDPDSVGRFSREAATAARIRHPNVVEIHDCGEGDDGLVYIAMEWVDGRALADLLGDEGALEPRRAVRLARQIAGALGAAHAAGIVHRDLKPDNILIAAAGTPGETAKVVDFGIAKALQAPAGGLTRTGFVVGTPRYMSPEQLIAEPLDPRSDLYSLGCILYEMLTGEEAWTGGDAVITRRLTEPPPHPRERNPRVPEALDAVVVRLLARSADERFQSAEALDAALAGLESEPAEAGVRSTAPVTVGTSARGGAPGAPEAPTAAAAPVAGRAAGAPAPEALPPPAEAALPRRRAVLAGAFVLASLGAVAIGVWAFRPGSGAVAPPAVAAEEGVGAQARTAGPSAAAAVPSPVSSEVADPAAPASRAAPRDSGPATPDPRDAAGDRSRAAPAPTRSTAALAGGARSADAESAAARSAAANPATRPPPAGADVASKRLAAAPSGPARDSAATPTRQPASAPTRTSPAEPPTARDLAERAAPAPSAGPGPAGTPGVAAPKRVDCARTVPEKDGRRSAVGTVTCRWVVPAKGTTFKVERRAPGSGAWEPVETGRLPNREGSKADFDQKVSAAGSFLYRVVACTKAGCAAPVTDTIPEPPAAISVDTVGALSPQNRVTLRGRFRPNGASTVEWELSVHPTRVLLDAPRRCSGKWTRLRPEETVTVSCSPWDTLLPARTYEAVLRVTSAGGSAASPSFPFEARR